MYLERKLDKTGFIVYTIYVNEYPSKRIYSTAVFGKVYRTIFVSLVT